MFRLCILSLFLIVVGFSTQGQIIYDNQYSSVGAASARSLNTSSIGFVTGGDRLLHTDFEGQEIFNVDGPANGAYYYPQDSGFVCVYNTYSSGNPVVTAHVKKLDKLGNELWMRTFDSGLWRNFAEDIVVLDDGMMVYTGRHSSVTGTGAVIRKLCPQGGQIWEYKWNSGSTVSTYGKEIFQVGTHFYVIGNANASNDGLGTNRDMFMSKHDYNNGATAWSYVYESDSIDDATDLMVLDENNFLLLGNTNADTLSVGNRGVLVSISFDIQAGVTSNWIKYYNSPAEMTTNDIELHPDGGYLILGSRASIGSDSIKTFVMAVDGFGEPSWEYVFANTGLEHSGQEMLRESSHVYVVSGNYIDEFGNDQFYQTKFDLTDLESPNSIVERADDLQIKVYPNPVSDVLSVRFSAANEIEVISIIDNLGGMVDSFNPLSSLIYYDCSRLTPGMYHVRGSRKSSFSRQFIVQ